MSLAVPVCSVTAPEPATIVEAVPVLPVMRIDLGEQVADGGRVEVEIGGVGRRAGGAAGAGIEDGDGLGRAGGRGHGDGVGDVKSVADRIGGGRAAEQRAGA